MDDRFKPTTIKLLQKLRVLELSFEDGTQYQLPCEYLRVYSPSAEVRGHGMQEPKLVTGKKDVNIIGIEPVGHYAVKLIFDDGHETGLYTWETLHHLATHYQENWNHYLQRVKAMGG